MTKAKPYKVAEHPLKCLVCSHDLFQERSVKFQRDLTTPPFNIDWIEDSSLALCLICERCGYIHWFLR